MKDHDLSEFFLPENIQELSEKNKKEIAIKLKSLPEYIYLIDKRIHNLLDDVKTDDISKILKKYPSVDEEIIKKLYYSYKKPDNYYSADILLQLAGFKRSIVRDKFIAGITQKIQKLQLKNIEDKRNRIKWSNFSTEQLRINISLDTRNELGNIFNTFVTRPEIPFGFLKRQRSETIYKIFFNYTVPKKWTEYPQALENKSFVLLKFIQGENVYNIFLFVTADEKLNIKLTVDSEHFYKTFIQKTLCETLNLKESTLNITRDKIRCKAEYNIESSGKIKQINKYVLLDQIFNNANFSKYLCVNEFEKASKEKTVIFAYFSDPGTEVSEDKRCPGQSIIITPRYDAYTDEEKFIVTVKNAKNEREYKHIFDTMGKLFYNYTIMMPKIVAFYQKYIPKFGKDKKGTKLKKKFKMGEVDKLLYDTKYGFSRLCQKGKPPKVIQKPPNFRENRIYDNGVLKFPETSLTTTSGIIKPKYYDCSENKKHKNVGLIKVNDHTHPTKYLPCCFLKKQDSKEPFNLYTEQGVKTLLTYSHKTKTKQVRLSDTDKFATQEYKIFDPKLNTDILKLITNTKKQFLRYGVYENMIDPNSLIRCVCEAFDEKYKTMTLTQKQDYITAKRQEYTRKDRIALCKQQLYDKNFQEITRILENTKNYFDPKLFLNFLQYDYDVNIFIFEKIRNNIKLITPKNQNGYYFSFHENSLLIYLNYGSQSLKNVRFPQCEIIAPWNGKDENVPLVCKTINKDFYINLNSGVIVRNKSINFYQRFHVAERPFISQALDNSGKTRLINFTYQNHRGVILTSPIEPLGLEVDSNPKMVKISIPIAKSFLQYIFGEIINVKYCLNSRKEINYVKYVKNSIVLEIPVISENNTEGRSVCIARELPEAQSALSDFETTRKLSNITKNYFLWLYSKYGQDMTHKKFAEKFTRIIKPYYIDKIDNRSSSDYCCTKSRSRGK